MPTALVICGLNCSVVVILCLFFDAEHVVKRGPGAGRRRSRGVPVLAPPALGMLLALC